MSIRLNPAEKIGAAIVAEVCVTRLHDQVERVSALIAGAMALMPESVRDTYAGDLLDMAMDDLGDLQNLRQLTGAISSLRGNTTDEVPYE